MATDPGDGAGKRVGDAGWGSAEDLSREERGRHYTADGITVFFNARKCTRSGVCLRGLPQVFDTSRRPWIRADLDTPETIAQRIDLCPSGALSYLLGDGHDPQEPV